MPETCATTTNCAVSGVQIPPLTLPVKHIEFVSNLIKVTAGC
jgi:hypothetical protein